MTNTDLIDWAIRIAESLATDKSNDWSDSRIRLNECNLAPYTRIIQTN